VQKSVIISITAIINLQINLRYKIYFNNLILNFKYSVTEICLHKPIVDFLTQMLMVAQITTSSKLVLQQPTYQHFTKFTLHLLQKKTQIITIKLYDHENHYI
jgi:hypothetical protein